MADEFIEKQCVTCFETQPLDQFRPGHRVCRGCNRARQRERVAALPEGGKVWNRERYQRSRTRQLERVKANRLALKIEVLNHYGGHCACCGEDDYKFLSLDHINQDGAAQRKATGANGGHVFYYWAKRNGFPDDLRVLCYNCNFATFRNNGVCPHEEARLKLAA